jgi:hypothetical protein
VDIKELKMPSGTGLGIARGLELGVQNFLNSYLAVKQSKHEEKYRKLAPVMQVIYSQIQDPSMPLDQRIKAADSIPFLLDPKYSGSKLSEQLGLDKLAEQQIETGEEVVSKGTPSKTLVDPTAEQYNKKLKSISNLETAEDGTIQTAETPMATSVNLKATQDTKKPLLKRRGEMSNNDIALAKQLKLSEAKEEDDFRRQYRIALVQADLQEKVLNKQGWKNNGEWTYNH